MFQIHLSRILSLCRSMRYLPDGPCSARKRPCAHSAAVPVHHNDMPTSAQYYVKFRTMPRRAGFSPIWAVLRNAHTA